jgi:UDP-glucose 4-epimerase
MMQTVHQDDLVQALVLSLKPGVTGVFNIAGPAPKPLSALLSLLGRTPLPVPYGFAKATLSQLFRLRVSSFPAPELDFLRYVCMVDDQKAKRELGYTPSFDLDATLRAVDEERWL